MDLQLAVDLAQGKRDAAAQALAQARQAWIAAQLQLDQLESYAQETTTLEHASFEPHAGTDAPPLPVHGAAGPRHRPADRHRRGAWRDGRGAAEALRQAECRLESLRQLHAAARGERASRSHRREQKLSDEQAALQYRRLAGSHAGGGLR